MQIMRCFELSLVAEGLTCKEVFLGIDKVVGGLVHFNLALPGLRHVPYPRVTGYYMKLKQQTHFKI